LKGSWKNTGSLLNLTDESIPQNAFSK